MISRKNRFRAAPLLATALALLLAPASAQAAGILSESGSQLEFEADTGVANVVSVTGELSPPAGGDTTFSITDTADIINVDAGIAAACEGEGTNTVTCTGDWDEWDVELDDENDGFSAAGSAEHQVDGDDGDDFLTGSDNSQLDDFNGGIGNDTMVGGGGEDEFSGGEGNDTADGGPGPDEFFDNSGDGVDTYQGGEGIDSIFYFSELDPAEVITVDLTAGTAMYSGLPDVDTLTGLEDVETSATNLSGNDVINGNERANEIETDEGNDTVNPQGGADRLFLDEGDDTADLRDGANDRVLCGAGTDTVQADQFDELQDCETVTVTQTRPAGADAVAPACTVAKVKKSYSRKAFFKGFRPDVDCNEAAALEITLVATVKRGNLVTARVGDLVLAQKTVAAGAAVPRIKAAKRFGRQLSKKRGFRARLVVEATDQYGNTSTNTKRVSVKKPKRKRGRKRR